MAFAKNSYLWQEVVMLVTSMLVATVVSLSLLHHFAHIMCSCYFIHTFTDGNHFVHTFTDSNHTHVYRQYRCVTMCSYCFIHMFRQYRCVTMCSNFRHTFTDSIDVSPCVVLISYTPSHSTDVSPYVFISCNTAKQSVHRISKYY